VKKSDRYNVSGLVEAQFEPGSRRRVLRNNLGIKSSREMDVAEARALTQAMEGFVAQYDEHHRFTATDICEMHRRWLGGIYPWAGAYRQVNISKGGFPFAAANRVPALMEDYSREALARYTPCRPSGVAEVARALAHTHVELVLIHPFREGNGRIARALSTLMGLQAGLPPLDFGSITGKATKDYFMAIQRGMDRDYRLMDKLFETIIERSLAGT
jgi:cell filamentation protein